MIKLIGAAWPGINIGHARMRRFERLGPAREVSAQLGALHPRAVRLSFRWALSLPRQFQPQPSAASRPQKIRSSPETRFFDSTPLTRNRDQKILSLRIRNSIRRRPASGFACDGQRP